jgi:hypothetical protein
MFRRLINKRSHPRNHHPHDLTAAYIIYRLAGQFNAGDLLSPRVIEQRRRRLADCGHYGGRRLPP